MLNVSRARQFKHHDGTIELYYELKTNWLLHKLKVRRNFRWLVKGGSTICYWDKVKPSFKHIVVIAHHTRLFSKDDVLQRYDKGEVS